MANMNQKIFALALAAGTAFSPCFAGDLTLESRAWPPPISCDACVILQFGILEMRLPTAQIEKIFISGKEPFAVHLLPKGAVDGRNGALLMSANRAAYIGKYQAVGLAGAESMSSQTFFDQLGHVANEGEPLAKIRHFENIDTAERYIKASKGEIHAYWIQAAPGASQYIHFAIDNDDTIYSLVGAVTPQLYQAALANLRVRAEP